MEVETQNKFHWITYPLPNVDIGPTLPLLGGVENGMAFGADDQRQVTSFHGA